MSIEKRDDGKTQFFSREIVIAPSTTIDPLTDVSVLLFQIYEEAIFRLAGTNRTRPEDFADECRLLGQEGMIRDGSFYEEVAQEAGFTAEHIVEVKGLLSSSLNELTFRREHS